jgi:hypothetical protein
LFLPGAGTAKEVARIIRHVDELKRRRALQSAEICIILESNNCWARSVDAYQALKAYERSTGGQVRFRFLCTTGRAGSGGDGPQIGIWLGRDNLHKLRLAMHFKHALMAKKIRVLNDFVSETKGIHELLQQQFQAVEIIDANKKSQTTTPWQDIKWEVSGKRHGKDDLAWATMEGAYYSALTWWEEHLCAPFRVRKGLVPIALMAERNQELMRAEVKSLYFH